jgi:hypothetical protein
LAGTAPHHEVAQHLEVDAQGLAGARGDELFGNEAPGGGGGGGGGRRGGLGVRLGVGLAVRGGVGGEGLTPRSHVFA